MLLKLYGLRDSIALDTLMILSAPNDGMLERNVKSLMLQGASVLMNNLQDLVIFLIGELDTTSGLIKGLSEPVQVFHCLELFEKAKEEHKKIFGEEIVIDESKSKAKSKKA